MIHFYILIYIVKTIYNYTINSCIHFLNELGNLIFYINVEFEFEFHFPFSTLECRILFYK